MRPRLFAILCLSVLFPAFAKAEKPNIILVMADDQGWGDTGYNGHPVVKTPNLDAMAGESLVFNRFYAAAPVCSPTRGSVLTGRHPIRIKITNHGRYMRPQESTLAEELHAAGYVTGMFGKWHVGSAQKDSPVNPGNSGFDEWVIGLNFFDNDPYLSRQGTVEQIKGSGSAITIDETMAFLRKHKDGEKPMFAVAWFPSPHDPHQEKPADPDMYADVPGGPYFGEITVLDQEFGRLRKELRDLGIEKNTILWYCSDNGGLREESSGGRGRKGSIYEGGLRVPGMIRWPARITAGQTDFPATTSDMLPTLLAAAGVERKGTYPLDGIDLMPVVEGKMTKREKPIGFWFGLQGGQSTWSDRILKAIMEAQKAGKPSPYPERLRKDIDEFPQFPEDRFVGHGAWLDWPWKLHRKQGKEGNDVTFELYNLATDPIESKDLSAEPENAERLQMMKKELAAWQLSVTRSLNGEDYGHVPATAKPYKVFLLGGQSNMDGCGRTEELPEAYKTPPKDVVTWDNNKKIWVALGEDTFAIRRNRMFGPELAFAHELAKKYPDHMIAITKTSAGGTKLHTQWVPDKVMYQRFTSNYENALQQLKEAGHEYEVAGMLWMQGESDSETVEMATTYEENLKKLIQDVRRRTGNEKLPFVMGRISSSLLKKTPWNFDHAKIVQKAQEAVAAGDANVHVINTDQLTTWKDNTHFDTPAQLKLGRDMASIMIRELAAP